jgi:flavin-dependent dehydrogenase
MTGHRATDLPDHDVVVVGGRLAGAATAMLLARAGHDVAIVERSPLPSDTNSTHSFARGGVVQLHRWGLLDEVLATGAPEIRTVSFHRDDTVVRRAIKAGAGVDFLLAPRRRPLDDVLARAATGAGAELRTGVTATGVVRDRTGRVAGVHTRDAAGHRREVRARLVVGADGVHSRMARYVGARTLEEHAASGTVLYTYVGDVPWDGFEFHLAQNAFAGVFPTHGGQACVWLIRPTDVFAPVLRAGASRTDAWLDALTSVAPDLGGRVRAGRVDRQLRGAAGLPNLVRRAAGPGWAVVGDAGYHRDPITGHGMTDAFRDAELLAEATDLVLRGQETEATAMASYERQRDAALADTFALTRRLAEFPPPAEFEQLLRQLSTSLDLEARDLAARPVPAGPVTSAA